MLSPPSQRLRAVAAWAPGDWAAGCAGAAELRVLKDHAGGTVWAARVLGRECVLKCWRLGWRRRAQSAARVSPAWRHARNARRLAAVGARAAGGLAIVRGEAGDERVECLVMEFIEGGTALEHLARGGLTTREEHLAAAEIGRLAGALARRGWLNRDAKLSNLMVRRAAGKFGLVVIDCADLRRSRDAERAAARMLASAFIEPLGCGLPPRRGLRLRAVRAAAGGLGHDSGARRLWARVERLVASHGDPTPRHDPLG